MKLKRRRRPILVHHLRQKTHFNPILSSLEHSETDSRRVRRGSGFGMPLAEPLPTMNLPSSPPNQLDCGPPLSQPCLCFREPCFAPKRSRDQERGSIDEDSCVPFGETTGLGEWGSFIASFGNVGSVVLGLSFGNNDIYDGQDLGCEIKGSALKQLTII